jgi:hypothetical protein
MNLWILTYEHGVGCECLVLNSEECGLPLSAACRVTRLKPKGGLRFCEGGCRSLRAGDERVLMIVEW